MAEMRKAVRWTSALAIGVAMSLDPFLLALEAFGLARLMHDHPELFTPEAALESVLAAIEETMAEMAESGSGF